MVGLLETLGETPGFGRIPRAARTSYRKLQTRLIYRSFDHFVKSIDGFDGKWVKDEERTPENESWILERIARSFISMTNDQRNTDSLYLPSHEWKRLLESQWIKHREAIVNHRYPELASLLRNLFRNESITGF